MSTKENAKVTPGPVQFRWRSLLGVSVALFLCHLIYQQKPVKQEMND